MSEVKQVSPNNSHIHIDPAAQAAGRPLRQGETYEVDYPGLRKDCPICNPEASVAAEEAPSAPPTPAVETPAKASQGKRVGRPPASSAPVV